MTALLAQGADPCLARALVLVDVTPTTEPEGTAKITEFMRFGTGGFSCIEEATEAVMAYNPRRSNDEFGEHLLGFLRGPVPT